MVNRVTAKTFKKYYDAIDNFTEDGEKAFEKCKSMLRDKEVYPLNDVIQILYAPTEFKDLQSQLAIQLLHGSMVFLENATDSQRRDLRDIVTSGQFSVDVDNKNKFKYLKGKPVFTHAQFIRKKDDFGERYYEHETTRYQCSYPSVGTINKVGKQFDPTNWINSLQRKNPEWDMDQIQAEMDRIRDWGGERGSQMHGLTEDYLTDRWHFSQKYNPKDYHSDVSTCFRKIFPYLRWEVDSTIFMEAFTEMKLDNIIGIPNAGVMGYPDHLGVSNGKIILNDWKSANKRKNASDIPNYFWQVAAYAMMIKNQFGISVDEARIVIAPVSGCLQVLTLDRDMIKRKLNEFLGYAKQYYTEKLILEKVT